MKLKTLSLLLIGILFFSSCAKKVGEAKFVIEVSDLDKNTSMEDCSELINKRLSQMLDKSRPDIKTKIVNNRMYISFDYCEEDSAAIFKVNQLLSSQNSEVQFWETFDNIELNSFWDIANKKVQETFGDSVLAEMNEAPTASTATTTLGAEIDEDKKRVRDSLSKLYPISTVLYPRMDSKGYLLPGPVIGYCSHKDTAKLMLFLNHHNIKKFFPRNAVFAFSNKPLEESEGTFEVYCLKKTGNGPAISGNCIQHAAVGLKQDKSPYLDLTFNQESAKEWERLTEKVAAAKKTDGNGNEQYSSIAIVMENKVLSAPGVVSKISGGRSEINGAFSYEDVHELVAKILYPMSFTSKIISEQLIPVKK